MRKSNLGGQTFRATSEPTVAFSEAEERRRGHKAIKNPLGATLCGAS